MLNKIKVTVKRMKRLITDWGGGKKSLQITYLKKDLYPK